MLPVLVPVSLQPRRAAMLHHIIVLAIKRLAGGLAGGLA
jgi:hypothetical protein